MTAPGRYLALCRRPAAGRVLGATLAWGLAGTMYPVVLVLFVHHVTGSYAAVGLVAAASAVGRSVLAPLRGRMVETRGASRSLLRLAVVQALAVGGLVAAGAAGAGAGVLAALALLAAAATPPVSAVTRALLSEMLAADADRHLGYSVLTILQELAGLGGPLLAGIVLLATPVRSVGVLVAGGLALAGTAWFAAARPVRARPAAEVRPTGLGALASPGVRTLMITAFASGIAFGVPEVAFPAFATGHGAPAAAGWLLAALSLGIGAGGLLYGLTGPSRRPTSTYAALCALSALGLLPLALPGSVGALLALAPLAGLCSAPMVTCQYSLIDRAARRGTEIEAFAWITSVYAGGVASGAAVAGWLAQRGSLAAAFLVAAGAMAAAAAIAAARRGTFVAAPLSPHGAST